ncbi:MAG: Eco57I restriction-modification methylase domain-containing protein [Lewinellaceae bacterium]|nr:Eco57I restriction-modification methylase domain-containing protein [Lewinellaceae bacterium]
MKEKDIKDILKSKFQLDEDKYFPAQWKTVLNLFFKKIEYFSHPENLFTENDKVIAGKQLGTVKLDDGKQLAIFTVEVANSISIVRNRQGLREIAAKHIDQNIIHGTLAFFYNKKQADYRFSFIAKEASIDLETGELIKGETKPKRYTYLLGSNEACTTPAKRMLVLADKKEKSEVNINQLKEVFSVEALNKDFFKTYKAHYEKFWKYLADEENPYRTKLVDAEKDDKVKQEKPIRDFAKKLLGRIVFLHFLQKKGWMGCSPKTKDWIDGEPRFMQQLFEDFSKPENFQSQCLTHLFFETLNTKRPNDTFEVKGLNGKLNGSRVPYLNGGLFEPEKNKATLKIDFPADYFKELLEFFEQYNFTIDENSPDDHEVGIDPEMLGHIFENLLEDNRDKGAFYTPKEIVQYMCKESLIQYLLNTFQEQKDLPDGKAGIEQFIHFHTVSPLLAEKENAILLNKKLDDIKVCDPAIGSGAFPIGMLQEIFEAKRFIYPYLKTNQDFKPAEVKKNIIQNSIYGVDLEKGAVDIAQLRFWLSLVVDELNPHPLPNLDYKIMQGNSLLEEFAGFKLDKLMDEEDSIIATGVQQLSLGVDFDAPKFQLEVFDRVTKEELWKLMEKFYDPVAWEKKTGEKVDKTQTKKDINDIIEGKIHAFVLGEQRKLRDEIAQKKKDWNIKDEDYSKLNQKSKDYKKFELNVNKLEQLNNFENQLIKLQESEERPFFLWHTWFKDVFEKGGFDVMIGNPPYIQLQKMGKETDILQEAGFETFARTGDIYCLFYEKGIDLLKKGGTLTYITSNKWMRGAYGKSLRNYFTKVNTQKILNLGPGIFHSATVDTNIYVGKKEPFDNQVKGISIENRFDISFLKEDELIPMRDVNEDAWVVLDEDDLRISKSFEKYGKQLKDWEIKINFGIKTGFNDAFIFDQAKRDELVAEDPKADEIIRPILKGREIERYYAEWSKDFIISTFPAKNLNIDDYPSIKNYLESFQPKLNQTGEEFINENGEVEKTRKKTVNKWFETQDPIAFQEEFKKEKVIWKRIGSIMRFAYSNEEMYCLDSTCIATGEKIKYLTAVLNSRAGLYQLFKTSPQTGTGDQIISVQALEPLLVHYPSEEVEAKFNLMVDYILCIKKSKDVLFQSVTNEHISGIFENLVNMMVYELYFEEEMKAKEIDVLQFVTEKAFPDITKSEDKKAIIQKVYYELQEKDNPIRNRILVASSRSETIARINAATS